MTRHAALPAILLLATGAAVPTRARQAVPREGATVLRPAHASERLAFLGLPETAAVLPDVRRDPTAVAAALTAARPPERPVYAPRSRLAVLATGPVLDSPDVVEVRDLGRRGNRFSVLVAHTQVRLQDAALLRNVQWRPVIAVRLPRNLPRGSYWVDVTWFPVGRLPDGDSLPGHALTEAAAFAVHAP